MSPLHHTTVSREITRRHARYTYTPHTACKHFNFIVNNNNNQLHLHDDDDHDLIIIISSLSHASAIIFIASAAALFPLLPLAVDD